MSGKNRKNFLLGKITGADSVCKGLDKIKKDKNIKGVVIRVDSPGGSAIASEQIFKKITEIKKTKKVIISMGNIATSGAYWLSLPANLIVAENTTLTGSIGVFLLKPVLIKLYEKLGIKVETYKSGKYSDMFNTDRYFYPEEEKMIDTFLDNVYSKFVERVSENRNIPVEQVKKLAEGKIYLGTDAFSLKLVDKIGNLNDAINFCLELANIKKQPKIIYYIPRYSILKIIGDYFLKTTFKSLLRSDSNYVSFN